MDTHPSITLQSGIVSEGHNLWYENSYLYICHSARTVWQMLSLLCTNNHSGSSATRIHKDRQESHELSEIRLPTLFSSDYYRKVDKTTDIAGRLPNAVYTLSPHIVRALIGLADVTDATREALVAECKKFYLAARQYEESKEVFVDGEGNRNTTITLDCGRLYSEGCNRKGQCGIGSREDEVTGPRLIRLPPVLQVGHCKGRWFANTTRGLYAWGWNYLGKLGVGGDEDVWQPRRVLIDGDVLDVSLLPNVSFFRTDSGWFGCGSNRCRQLGLGHNNKVTTPTPIPGSEGVTRWGGGYGITFGFSDDGLLACGANRGQYGHAIRTLMKFTPVALPGDVKCRVDRVVSDVASLFFIADRRCFVCGCNMYGQLGLGSNERDICTPTELPLPVDDVISHYPLTVIRSGDTLLACGDNEYRQILSNAMSHVTTRIILDLPGPVVKVVCDGCRIFFQLTDGVWVGRGMCDSRYFIPVPEADLIDNHGVPRWMSVTARFVARLNAREPDVDVMFLPVPITNVIDVEDLMPDSDDQC